MMEVRYDSILKRSICKRSESLIRSVVGFLRLKMKKGQPLRPYVPTLYVNPEIRNSFLNPVQFR
jgi:hypothetical protein